MAFTDYIPIIGDAVNLFGGVMANRANAKENQKNREWSERMWHLNNEYNLPVNQIQRFRDAGLSAALAYGQGTSTLAQYAGNMPASRGYENPAKNIDTAAIAQLHIQDKVANSQISLQDSEAAKNDSEAKKNEATTENVEWDNIIKSQTYETAIDTAIENLAKLKADRAISEKQYEIQLEILEKAKEQAREAKAIADRAEEAVNTQTAETRLYNTGADLNEEKKTTEITQQGLNKKQGQYYDAAGYNQRQQGKLARSEAAYYDELKKNQPVIRKELRANTALAYGKLKESLSAAGLNDATADKVSKEAVQLVMNGKVDRAVKLIDAQLNVGPRRYGTGPLGSAAGMIMDMYDAIKSGPGHKESTW